MSFQAHLYSSNCLKAENINNNLNNGYKLIEVKLFLNTRLLEIKRISDANSKAF